jgi:hypothetical protein
MLHNKFYKLTLKESQKYWEFEWKTPSSKNQFTLDCIFTTNSPDHVNLTVKHSILSYSKLIESFGTEKVLVT